MKITLPLFASLAVALASALHAADVTDVDPQPLLAQVRRVIEAATLLGVPFTGAEKGAVDAAANKSDAKNTAEKIQATLDPRCLFVVTINPEMRVKVAVGAAKADLVEQGWRTFFIKVVNDSGTTAPLNVFSAQAQSAYSGGAVQNASDKRLRGNDKTTPIDEKDVWLDMQTFDQPPLLPALSGLRVEYRIVSLYSRDAGKREATFSFDVGQGTQDLGFRGETSVLFHAAPARAIALHIHDEKGAPTTASLLIRDRQGRVYPSQTKRLAPDFGFHPQIYRADGESIRLPDGEYAIEFSRGPESVAKQVPVRVGAETHELAFAVERWIDPAQFGWWSGDHHIHAAGCAHYTNPSEGVHASDMMRHCLGEDLKVGCNLTWGPCFDYQKQFFTGQDDKVSHAPYLLHYDVEVSGFGSHQSGHLCLLELRQQIIPGGESDHHWPTLGLNTLRWAKKQGALVGPAHSGWGLNLREAKIPSEEIPPFNGIGANEYIVDVTHEVPGPDGKLVPAVDFMSTVDTPWPWELNIWYHTLNVGYRTRISGETDFPCIYGERVGLGRSYVKLPTPWTYADWCEGIRAGRNYVSDGYSHLLDFKVNDTRMGEDGSEFKLDVPATVHVSARVAARLGEKADDRIRRAPVSEKPYWHLERARIADTREVPVELIVNGRPVATTRIVADGKFNEVAFDVNLDRSSWLALRILPSSHTNPIFALVGGKPVRASKQSAEWCRKAVDQCWSQKERTYARPELAAAHAAYDYAREVFDRLITESSGD